MNVRKALTLLIFIFISNFKSFLIFITVKVHLILNRETKLSSLALYRFAFNFSSECLNYLGAKAELEAKSVHVDIIFKLQISK